MFGGAKTPFAQAATTSSFGFNNTPTASPFGQTAFGKPQTSGFGQPATFGQSNTSLFGGANQSTGLFGSTNAAPAFGTNAATTQSGFGSFGQQPTTSLFGNPQTNTNTSLFGSSSTSAFGNTTKPTAFGFGSPQTSLFGSTNTTAQPATGGFFGQSQPTGLFGASTSAFGAQQNQQTGTAHTKYQPSMGTDTLIKNGGSNQVNTKQHCITSMKEYENKSLEELRLEDYMENRKGPQTGQTSTGLFGTNTNTGGMFGSQMQQPSTGIFGQTENKNLFGNTNNLGFGQTNTGFGANQSNSLFAKPFGNTMTAASTSSFGGFSNTTTNANPFGAKPAFGATQTTGSIFGQPSTSTAPAFGQSGSFFNTSTNQQPNNLFGNTDNKSSFGLGATQTSNTGFGAFGTNNTNTNTLNNSPFGMNKPASSFAFGASTQAAPASGFGSFGQTSGTSLFNSSFNNKPAAPAFGSFTPQTNAPLMGNTGGGLNLGTNNQSFFGNTTTKPGSLFGNTTGQTTSLFGNNSFGGGMGSFGNTNLTGTTSLGGTTNPQSNNLPIHPQILALTSYPYGENPIFKDLKTSGVTEESLKATNPAVQKAILESTSNQFKVSSKVGNSLKIKPVGGILTKKSLFEGLEEHDSSLEESFNLSMNAKRLIINKKTLSMKKNQSSTQEIETGNCTDNNNVSNVIEPNIDVRSNLNEPKENDEIKNDGTPRRDSWLNTNMLEKLKQTNRLITDGENLNMNNTEFRNFDKNEKRQSSVINTNNQNNNRSVDETSNVIFNNEATSSQNINSSPSRLISNLSYDSLFSPNKSYLNESNQEVATENIEPHPTGIVLTRFGYYTIPSLDDLIPNLKEDGTCIVPNFTVGRKGYGNVYFEGPLDVANLNLDEIVFFRNKEVIIYPDDDNKPPQGQGLNRKAQITLDQVWPMDKTIHEPIKDPVRLNVMDYEGKLRRACDKHNTRFVEYRPQTGSWVFRVQHFSKYGLHDSDEEDDAPTDPKKAKLSAKPLDNNKEMLMKNSNIQSMPSLGTSKTLDTSKTKNFEDLSEIQTDFNYDQMIESNEMYLPMNVTRELAMGMGIDSHKLQLMKASFFADDECDARSTISDYIYGRESPDQIVPTRSAVLSKKSSQSDKEIAMHKDFAGIDTISIDSGIMPVIKELPPILSKKTEQEIIRKIHIKPKRILNELTKTILPVKDSVFEIIKGNCVSDIEFMNGRKFKVGWGLKNSLIVLNTELNSELNKKNKEITFIRDFSKYFPSRRFDDNSNLMLKHLKIVSRESSFDYDFKASVENHLEIELSYIIRDENSICPLLKAGGSTAALEEHYEEAKKLKNLSKSDEIAGSVWSLCKALWGEREELDNLEPSHHFTIMRRRELFSKWLEDNLNNKKNNSKMSYLKELLELLMSHKVSEACELAFINDDINLSMLLAQISGGPVIRQLMNHQLSQWQEVEADQFISIERLKAYMLIAGVPVLASSHGPINIFEELDWITCLALHTWYLSTPTSSLTDSLLMYDHSFETKEFPSKSPHPPYEAQILFDKPVFDIRYHLLKLFSKKSHQMEPILNPATYTSDPLDYRLSWMLLQTLESLGYNHCSELSETQIHISFASQLETYDLWHWSIFVLLHIKNSNRREMCVQQMLYKYIKLSDDTEYLKKERFIIENLGIPENWVFWAKSVHASSIKDYHEQAKYLLKAKQWSQAHEIIMQHIVPDAIINDNIDYAKKLLEDFEDRLKISNWINQGQIILDYIDISEKFEQLKIVSETDLETYWEALKPQLADLCSRINLYPCPTAKHRLCQSEISQKLAHLIRGILLTSDANPCLVIKVALEKLPLPQEYAQQELRVLLDTYFSDLDIQIEN